MSSKITDLATITGAALATTDWLMTVDISDATMALSGTDKKVSVGELLVGMGGLPLAGGTMTGQITSTLGTITTDIRALSGTVTWNNSGTMFRGIFLNVTNTASALSSTLLELQVAGTEYLGFRHSSYELRIGGSSGIYLTGIDGNITTKSNADFRAASFSAYTISNAKLRWPNSTPDVAIERNGAGVVEVNNGTAGTLRDVALRSVYGNGTDINIYDGVSSNNKIFRGLFATGWTDSAAATHFQVGTNTGRAVFAAASATAFNRVLFVATAFQVASAYTTAIIPDASAIFIVDSTTKGWAPPRMTTTQKNAIGTPMEGLEVYDLTLHKKCVYTGAAWETITSA